MKLYTRTGDDGETSLHDGTRVGKDDPTVAAYGTVDELNAAIGLVITGCENAQMRERLAQVQNDLFDAGADLATPLASKRRDAVPTITDDAVSRLEGWIDDASASTAPLRTFVLPGGTETSARLHVARTLCRRAEREVVTLVREQAASATVLIYLNRLSDLLFAWARQVNAEANVADVAWNPKQPSDKRAD
jgi:cob(I)alamin adenosyltransferase